MSSRADGVLLRLAKVVTPVPAKTRVQQALRGCGTLTAAMRTLPHYLIVGGKRCGTTSLHNYLLAHPDVAPIFPRAAHIKGVHYFDRHAERSVLWYRSFFPLTAGLRRAPACGEASPYYLIHPYAAERAARTVPTAKIIILLRDPTQRAYSHYKDEVRNGHESLCFQGAIEAEPYRLAPELARMATDPYYYSFTHERLSYLTWGRYAEHLERWLCHFPRNQILLLKSEQLFAEPDAVFQQVTEFLGLRPWLPRSFPQYNATSTSRGEGQILQPLREYYAPFNEELARLLPDAPRWPMSLSQL